MKHPIINLKQRVVGDGICNLADGVVSVKLERERDVTKPFYHLAGKGVDVRKIQSQLILSHFHLPFFT